MNPPMNSKLRELLLQYRAEVNQGLNQLAGHGTAEEQAEKAIRQAVGEEMLELINNELSGFEAGGEIEAVMNTAKSRLRQKIKQWQGETTE